MGLYVLDYGAGNVQSLANSLHQLGHSYSWITESADFDKASILIFPGVGAFHTAIQYLQARGLLEPLRRYLLSGRPYLGICIGLQILFASSDESDLPGLGIIPAPIHAFESSDKPVPHIGWNSAYPLHPSAPSSYYYFVHSYSAIYDPNQLPVLSEWAYSTTQYGRQIFISSVRNANIFATQFHPEKSGTAGLALLDTWLRNPSFDPSSLPPQTPTLLPNHPLTKRIIACMDVRTNDQGDLVVTKGDQYDVRENSTNTTPTSNGQAPPLRPVRNLGKPVALAARYYSQGADEICLLNITSYRHSPLLDQPMLAVVRAAAETVFVPLTIGGGIKDTIDPDGTKHSALEVAGAYFRAGADKVSIGSEAVYAVEQLRASGEPDGKSPIETIAHAYGRQAVVVSIDPRRVYVDPETYYGPYKDELVIGRPDGPENERGKAWWYQCTVSGGRQSRQLSVVELTRGVQLLGAGELLVNSIDRDGTGLGFDLDLLNLIKRNATIPVVASSGAGSADHFIQVFQETGVEAALAAGIFHREEVLIEQVKAALQEAHTNVRAQ